MNSQQTAHTPQSSHAPTRPDIHAAPVGMMLQEGVELFGELNWFLARLQKTLEGAQNELPVIDIED